MPYPREVAALYVQPTGAYAHQLGVDAWDEQRDARRYRGPHPVVAHPPCQRWGRYAYGSPRALARGRRLVKGADGGCFAAALASVRTHGGVLEHPVDSSAWRAYGLTSPPRAGGWVPAGDGVGLTCCVEQGHYGHPARKPTWLYAVGVPAAPLAWGASTATRPVELMSRRQRAATPAAFRDLLLALARAAVA